MTTYVVSRHPGAVDWVRHSLNDADVRVLSHLDEMNFRPGDKVCGVLPISWAARICAAGAEAHVLTFDVPAHLRGAELDANMLTQLGTRLVRYDVRALD